MEQKQEPQERKWVYMNKDQLVEITSDFKRYRLMFRILFAYLIFDVFIHFDLLS
jgi:hypothetical protein